MTEGASNLWVVDRIEGRTLVLVEDASGRTAEVDRGKLAAAGASARSRENPSLQEGAVLRVPIGPDGEPVWAEGVIDEAARRARLDEAERLLGELKRRDPGGDVEL